MTFFNDYESSLEGLLRQAGELLAEGRKDEARDVLGQALSLDRNNLTTWELLWKAAYTEKEELSSVRHILKIDPRHAAAKKRMSELQKRGVTVSPSKPQTRSAASRQRRQQATVLLSLFGAFVFLVCVSVTGLALYRSGYLPFGVTSNLTATALVERNASCQALIERTIQASENFCDQTASNTACYGNNTLQAELAPGAMDRFSERGDMVAVDHLHRLTASPLNLDRDEWGIAVFKVVANLPRSLPGETVTMVVFGNSTLDNQSGTSESLESFYFSSDLGQIVCEKIPFDGLMVTSPNGSGVRFNINGAELTLTGDANIKAVKNGEMEVSIYRGSARITANGQEQYFGAGQKVSVQLGGPNGNESISAPSAPEPLSPEEMTIACTMTGHYCSPAEIATISPEQAQLDIQNAITFTPTPVGITSTPSPTVPPTFTVVVLPGTLFPRTDTPTPVPTATRTRTPLPTRTRTNTPLPPTNTPTRTFTPTETGTVTPEAPSVASCTTVTGTLTASGQQLVMQITNNNGTDITITQFFAYWNETPASQKISELQINGTTVWNPSDPDSPTNIPLEGNWINNASLIIPAAPPAPPSNLQILFSDILQAAGYEVHVVFDLPDPAADCQVSGSL